MEGYGKIALEQEACELNFKRVGRERERCTVHADYDPSVDSHGGYNCRRWKMCLVEKARPNCGFY